MELKVGEIYWVAGFGPMRLLEPPNPPRKTTVTLKQPTNGTYWAGPEQLTHHCTQEDLLRYEKELLSHVGSGFRHLIEQADVIRRWAYGLPEKKLYAVVPLEKTIERLKKQDWDSWHARRGLGSCFSCDCEEEALALFNASVSYTNHTFSRDEVEINVY